MAHGDSHVYTQIKYIYINIYLICHKKHILAERETRNVHNESCDFTLHRYLKDSYYIRMNGSTGDKPKQYSFCICKTEYSLGLHIYV